MLTILSMVAKVTNPYMPYITNRYGVYGAPTAILDTTGCICTAAMGSRRTPLSPWPHLQIQIHLAARSPAVRDTARHGVPPTGPKPTVCGTAARRHLNHRRRLQDRPRTATCPPAVPPLSGAVGAGPGR